MTRERGVRYLGSRARLDEAGKRRGGQIIRLLNGDQMNRVSMLAMHHKPSVDFCGYWQRHVSRT
jgi:hypothetical protein